MRRSLLVLFFLLVSCGGSEKEGKPPTPSEDVPGQNSCTLERGAPLSASLSGNFQLEKIVTSEGDKVIGEETVMPDKTLLLKLQDGGNATTVFVENTLTTEKATQAKGKVTREGDSRLAVLVEESTVPLVSPGATYCLVLKVGKDSFTVVLPVTSGKSYACQFARKVAP